MKIGDKAQYGLMYERMEIKPGRMSSVIGAKQKILSNKGQYQTAETLTTVPWDVIGCIHFEESQCDFSTHLANGDPLTGDTYHVPAKIMSPLPPPYAWTEAAQKAIEWHAAKKEWNINLQEYVWDAAGKIWFINSWHGFGAEEHGIYDPYCWSFTQFYQQGGFPDDDDWVPDYVYKNPGAVPILKQLEST